MMKEFHITTAQSPRQGPHEREHDAHGAEGAPARVRYHVAQYLEAKREQQCRTIQDEEMGLGIGKSLSRSVFRTEAVQ